MALRLPARIGTEERLYDGMAADFSEAGVQIETSGPFSIGAVLMVYIHFPSATVPVKGRIVRCDPGEPFVGGVITQGGAALMKAYERWAKAFGGDRSPAALEPGPEAPAGEPTGPSTSS